MEREVLPRLRFVISLARFIDPDGCVGGPIRALSRHIVATLRCDRRCSETLPQGAGFGIFIDSLGRDVEKVAILTDN